VGTKTTVGTTVMRVIEDKDLPGSIQTGVTKALLKQGEMVDYVLEELVTGIGIKAQRMYEYAKGGAYVHGLPSGQYTTGVAALEQVTAALQTIEGGALVDIGYSRYGPPNNLHIGWFKLMADHGYNPSTNQLSVLTAAKGTPVYLDDMVVVVPQAIIDNIEPTTLSQWGIAPRAGYTPKRTNGTAATRKLIQPSLVEVEAGAASEYLRVTYGWEVAGVYTLDSFTIPVLDADYPGNYFHARYTVGGVVKYWLYRDGEGTFPALDAVYDRAPVSNGSYFPFAYFRHDKRSEISDKTTDAYKTSKKLVSYLGMDYDQVATAVDTNPGIADVQQAILMMAVPANTANQIERKYLWRFFNNMFLAGNPGTTFSSPSQAEISPDNSIDGFKWELFTPSPEVVIQDTRFRMVIENGGIYKRRMVGNIGAVGSYHSGHSIVSRMVDTWVDSESGQVVPVDFPVKYHYYRRQVTSTLYDEILVAGMRTVFRVIGAYSTIGDEEDDILLIPLDYSITKTFSVPDREILYARSLHYVFNSVVYTKVKWYQTGIFRAILVIVAVAIAWKTMGASLKAVAVLLAAGSYAAAAIIILGIVIEYIVVQIAFKLFVKVVGVDIAILVAVIAAVTGVVQSIDAGSVAGAPWAETILQVSSGISKAVAGQVQADMQDLVGEFQAFSLFKETEIKLLEDAKALLNGSNRLDPFVIFGESPGDFYNRTVHSGNIGVVGISAISNYVDIALQLPKLRDTLGEGEQT
jgi:hypothetical protein